MSLQSATAGTVTQAAGKCGVVFISDPSKAEPLTTGASAEVRSLAAAVNPRTPINIRVLPNEMMIAFDAPAGITHYVAVAMLPRKGIGPPPLLWWQGLIAVLVSAFACFVLTRHFVAPIRTLQLSTESFGHGKLDSRPAASLLARSDELGDLSKTIGQMSSRISGLLSSQKNFFIQVSHELGSPLTRLNVALALARRKASPAMGADLDRIQCESSELNALVQQLLRLARLESGLEHEEQESYSLYDLVREVCLDNQLIAAETGKQLHLLSVLHVEMSGYRELLKRALDNVLRNALRFTPEGSRVEVTVLRSPNNIAVIRVTDSGTGVQADKLEAIFEPFVRASSDRSGSGLGLAIAKRAVLANRGTIRAFNLEERGFVIEITLPCVDTETNTSAVLQDSQR
jgi:two-component system sensor histidine kinase CpxA